MGSLVDLGYDWGSFFPPHSEGVLCIDCGNVALDPVFGCFSLILFLYQEVPGWFSGSRFTRFHC